MNFINIAGHLGADPEVRFTSSGKKVTTLRVATRTRKGQTDDTIWWRVTIWGEQYDKMMPHLKKGGAIIVAGDVHKPEIFTDKEGKPQISLEITAYYLQFSPFGKPGGNPSGQHSGEGHTQPQFGGQNFAAPLNPYAQMPSGTPAKGETFDDEVPF
ncbi:MAG: single-stranded DNA-binding protein [Chlamydiia bacterium]|nr:single-stranded DNA-binding protein [Chlamydiia bacterium]